MVIAGLAPVHVRLLLHALEDHTPGCTLVDEVRHRLECELRWELDLRAARRAAQD